MPAVITIGEILADLVPEGKFYILMPGGAVSNVAVNLARFKVKTGIISKIGDDFLGKFLLNFLIKNNVDVSCVTKIKKYKTGLVFVFLDKKGERDFSFYGNPSADQFLNVKDIKEEYIKGCELLHFGSISMIGYKSRAATLKAIKIAKKYGKKISYDPNVRINLAENGIKKFKENIKRYFKYADIIKISEDELKFLFNLTVKQLSRRNIFGDKIVFISCGAKGCYVKYNKIFEYVKGYKVKVVDTTGAGDAFMASIIYKILKMKIFEKGINKKSLITIARFANKIGAKAVTKKGAV
jgi:sugar/nucleoside kinase (ribokinase family)